MCKAEDYHKQNRDSNDKSCQLSSEDNLASSRALLMVVSELTATDVACTAHSEAVPSLNATFSGKSKLRHSIAC